MGNVWLCEGVSFQFFGLKSIWKSKNGKERRKVSNEINVIAVWGTKKLKSEGRKKKKLKKNKTQKPKLAKRLPNT